MKKVGGIGVRVVNGRIQIDCMNANGEIVLAIPTTARGLFKLSDMIGALACKLTGLHTNEEVDAFVKEGNNFEDGQVEEHPIFEDSTGAVRIPDIAGTRPKATVLAHELLDPTGRHLTSKVAMLLVSMN